MNVKTLETFTPLSCSLKVLDRISKVYAYIKEDHINSLCKTLTRAGKDTRQYKLFMSIDGKYTSISKSVLIENYLLMKYLCLNGFVVKVLDF